MDNKEEKVVEQQPEEVVEKLDEIPVPEGQSAPSEDKKDKKTKRDKHVDSKLKEENQKLLEQISKLQEENQNLVNKVKLTQAELVNYRKRKDEETANMLKFANQDLVTELINVVDNFERAIKMDDDNLEDEVSKFLSGFKMIYSNLALTLQNFEVKAIDGANKPFDPVYHDAVMTEHRDDLEPGMIIEVLQKGYMLKDRVIRPAMVKVSE